MKRGRRPPGRLVDVGGFRLHIHGEGTARPAVVFDAALGASSISWTYVHPAVALFARACVYGAERAAQDRPRCPGALVDTITRGGVRGDADWILAPLWKLPPEARRPLRSFWTKAKFFEALGSQIETMAISARETLEAGTSAYRDLPLVTLSSSEPNAHGFRNQDALAATSALGRHIIAANSGHWIPLDEPQLIVDVIRDMHGAGRGAGSITGASRETPSPM